MKKRVLLLLLIMILPIFLMGGNIGPFESAAAEWDQYEDTYNELFANNSTVLNNGFNCEYEYSNNGKNGYDSPYSNIKVKVNKEGFNFNIKSSLGGTFEHKITNAKEITDRLDDRQKIISYFRFSPNIFLNAYAETGSCQAQIYACTEDKENSFIEIKTQIQSYDYNDINYYGDFGVNAPGGCYNFNLKSASSGGNGNGNGNSNGSTTCTNPNDLSHNEPCIYPCAKSCDHKYLKSSRDEVYFLEMGAYGSGSTKTNYFGIAKADNYDDATRDILFSAKEIENGRVSYSVTDRNSDVYIIFYDEVFETDSAGRYAELELCGTDKGGNYEYYINRKDSVYKFGDICGRSEIIDDPTQFTDGKPFDKLDIKDISICSVGSGTLKAMQIIGYVLFVVKIIVPLILIVMASIDFAKALISSSEKPNKDILMGLIKRVIVAVIIFLVPTILNFLLSYVDGTTELTGKEEQGFPKCTKCLLDPFGGCK